MRCSDGVSPFATAAFVCVTLFVASVAGCAPQAAREVAQATVKLPIITLGDAYPRGETPEQFWGEKTAFFQDYERRLNAGQVEAREQEALRQLYEIETVRRAAEARIREYNKFARETNRANNY